MNSGKNLVLWLIIGAMLVFMFNAFDAGKAGMGSQLAFSDFMEQAKQGNVKEIVMKGPKVSGTLMDGSHFSTYSPYDPNMVSTLLDNKVKVSAAPMEDGSNSLMGMIISWLPMILLVGVWIFFMRQMQSGGGKAMSFGKSKARMLDKDKNRITFKDVAGVDEAKEDLEEIIDFLKDPVITSYSIHYTKLYEVMLPS